MKSFFAYSLILLFAASNASSQSKFNYTSRWKTIDRLMESALPQSALPEIESVYQAALKDKEYGQLIKAVITRNNCYSLTAEYPQTAVIVALKRDAETIPFPAKPVIYSLTGEALVNYYNRNRWKIYDRTALAEDSESEDIETWGAARLIREIARYYRLSLVDATLLQKISVDDFKEALEGDAATRYLRPTLYDFLAHRAIDMYMQNDLTITDFAQPFPLDRVEYFADARGFAESTISSPDTLSTAYIVLKLFRDLTAFRLTQNDMNALTDVDLKRFTFLKDRGIFDNVDELYEDAMKHLIDGCAGQKIWGKAVYTLADYYGDKGKMWEYDKTYGTRFRLADAVNLCREIQKHALLKDDRKAADELLKSLTRPEISLQSERLCLPEKPILASVKYKNMQTAYLTVYRCTDENLDEMNRLEDPKKNLPGFLAELEKAATQTIALPAQKDYQQHSVEIKVDSLSLGLYLLVMSDEPYPEKGKSDVVHCNSMQTTYIKVLQRANGDGGKEIYTLHAATGRPLRGAEIDIMRSVYDTAQRKYTKALEKTISTDSLGMANIPSNDHSRDNTFRIRYGDETLSERQVFTYVFSVGDKAEKERRTVFFTDRAIYRPGQTVHFKGLVYETDNDANCRILPKIKTKVTLTDVNGKEIANREFTTNDYGSFNGSFTLPQGLLNGNMSLSGDPGGYVSFAVEEYKRPTFEVTIDPITADYALGDSITVTGTAKSLAGYAVDGAKAEFNVRRDAMYRTFRRHIYPPMRGNSRHIASGTLQTDEKGRFTVKFPAKADDIKKDDDGIYQFEVTVDVTDNNGETRSEMRDVKLSRVPLLIESRVPDKIVIGDESAVDLKYELKTVNLNGNDVPAKVHAEVYALKSPDRLLRDRLWEKPDTFVMSREEFVAEFPNDPYLDENDPWEYAKERLSASWDIDTKKDTKIDLGVLKNEPTGWYFIRLKTTDAQNRVVSDSMRIQLLQPKSPVTNMNEWLTVIKAGGEPGEQAVFRIAGADSASLIRYDVLFENKVVERKTFTAGTVPTELRFPIAETYRGGFAVLFAMVQNNRAYTSLQEIKVPYTDKQLDIAFTTFRGQLLPGEKEKWTLTVKNKKGERQAAEMAATLYDASLDMFAKNDWTRSFYQNRSYHEYNWRFSQHLARQFYVNWPDNQYFDATYRVDYEHLLSSDDMRKMRYAMSKNAATTGAVNLDIMDNNITIKGIASVTRQDEPPVPSEYSGDSSVSFVTFAEDESSVKAGGDKSHLAAIPLRANFSETAFFYPELRTNEKGEISVEFTVPEALTRWNMLGFAHTKDFKIGNVVNSLITQKQVAVSANLPRFFRVGDTLILSAKVNNLTEKDMNGNALLRLYDAFTMQPADGRLLQSDGTQAFSVKAGQSAAVQWKLAIPEGIQAVTYRLTAQAGNHTDGEERSVPVLAGRTLVTETMPFMVRADQRKDFRFDKPADNASSTLQNHRLTLEYTSNPAWYAVQALPYLMDYPYECAEQTFSRFYANALATTVANSSPRIKQIFNQWRSLPDSKALLSNLEKNQDLKQALLEETPWVVQAGNETERKKRIGLLFDLNRMANEQKRDLDKLKALQSAGGGFPWFAGQPEDRFVTQHIVAGLEHLRKLGALPRTDDVNNMIERAMAYCDERIAADYRNTLKQTDDRSERGGRGGRERRQIDRTQLHYLYACSFSKHYPPEIQAFDFYLQQAERFWTRFNTYEQAMTALVMYRFGKADVAYNILRSLKERAQMSDDMGMYWADNRLGYFWNESPVETQAMLIEAFNEAGSDTRAVSEMKIWLLRNKQTSDWKTTKATSEAVYALLSTSDGLSGDNSEPLDIRIGGKPLKKVVKEPLRPEAGTGYVSTSWNGSDIKAGFADLRITNPNTGIVWGAMYWQYFEDLDKIASAETNLQINKRLFIKRSGAGGKTLTPVTSNDRPQVGDVVTVRMELRADRDFEYVHLKDMRAAGFEPVNTLSGYRFQGGLGYYESIKDASTNFFITYLRKGTYVFEYDLRVSHAGDFSAGIGTFQCMYAPEFNAHTEGVRVKVGK